MTIADAGAARSLEQELIPACHRYGIDVVIYNPLAGGLFSGKIKSAETPNEGRFSDTASQGACTGRGISKMPPLMPCA